MERLGTRVGRSEESAGVILKSGTAAAGADMELGACSAVVGAGADDTDMVSSRAKRLTAPFKARPAKRETGLAGYTSAYSQFSQTRLADRSLFLIWCFISDIGIWSDAAPSTFHCLRIGA